MKTRINNKFFFIFVQSTPYLQKLYGGNNDGAQEVNHATEINFDDL